MTKEQILELVAIQRSIFDAVTGNDQSKLQEQLQVSQYWIRKQIWRRVQAVMMDCDDPVKAANFGTKDIVLHENAIATFLTCQASLIENGSSMEGESIKREAWVKYVKWVGELINSEISNRTGRYIKVRAKRKK